MTACRRCGCSSPRVKMSDNVCVSEAQCAKRRKARVGVRLVLENPPTPTSETDERRIEREIRRVLYRYGLCTDCGVRPHSPGRPRCDVCHDLPAMVRILMG